MKSTELTKEQLILEDVADGVAKWGENERAGLKKMAARKSLETLRAEYDMRHGRYNHNEAISRQVKSGRAVVLPKFGFEGNS